METKVWAALCALLLVNLGSADHDNLHSNSSSSSKMVPSEATPTGPAAESVPVSNPDPVTHAVTAPSLSANDSSSSPGDTRSLSNSSTAEVETIPQTPAPSKENGTSSTSPPEVANPQTDPAVQLTTQPPVSPSGSHIPTSHIPPHSTTISPPHTTQTAASVDSTTTSTTTTTTTTSTTTTTQSAHTTHHVTSPPLDGGTPSNQSSQPTTDLLTSTPKSGPAKLEPNTSTIAGSTSAPSISSSQQPPISVSSTHAEPSQPDQRHETSSAPHSKSSVPPPSSPSAQAKTHDNNPSQLNVGGDTKMVHEPHTLNPLLAGLVSAFIVMAVIITLVLFLKLRRRNNRPEFRRLQDLPMDDMMEDTPLSMYTY